MEHNKNHPGRVVFISEYKYKREFYFTDSTNLAKTVGCSIAI